jgi:tRNA A-37 threonylcarbamoyl transferase component Bud32
MHIMYIYHGNIKPQNIIVNGINEVYIIDFKKAFIDTKTNE